MSCIPLKRRSGLVLHLLDCFAGLSLVNACGAFADTAAAAPDKAPKITVLYDAFGKSSTMKKDWGFSAYIEYGGKKILF